MRQSPPLLKYDYKKIGIEYSDSLIMASEGEINYREIDTKTEQWLIKHAPEDYCLRQVLKMCHYVSSVRKHEILSMHADFYVDTND